MRGGGRTVRVQDFEFRAKQAPHLQFRVSTKWAQNPKHYLDPKTGKKNAQTLKDGKKGVPG